MIAECPIVTWFPIIVGNFVESICITELSCILVPSPIFIKFASPLIVVWCQTEQFLPISTAPIIAADLDIKAVWLIFGVCPKKVSINIWCCKEFFSDIIRCGSLNIK